MTNTKHESVWNLISEYTFKIDFTSISEDPICVICNKIIIDVYQSECGCQYCYKCIKNYLSNDKKYCPGKKEECKEEYLVMEKGVIRNKMMNNKISNMKVKCPNDSCDVYVELSKMEDHIRSCCKQTIECPYIMIGCDNLSEPKDVILSHLHNDSFKHAHLLLGCIQSLRSEIKTFKDDFQIKTSEIIYLTKQLRLKEVQMEEQKKEIVIVKKSSKFNKVEIEKLKKEIVSLQKNSESKNVQMEDQHKELDLVQKISEFNKVHMEEQRKEIDALRSNSENNKAQLKEQRKEIDLLKKISDCNKNIKNQGIDLKNSLVRIKATMASLEKELEMNKIQRVKERSELNNLKVKCKKKDNMKTKLQIELKDLRKNMDSKIFEVITNMEKKDKIIEILRGQIKALRNDVNMERDILMMMRNEVNKDDIFNESILNEFIIKRESVAEMMNETIVKSLSTILIDSSKTVECIISTESESNTPPESDGNDKLIGSGENDLLVGSEKNDVLVDSEGNDVLFGSKEDLTLVRFKDIISSTESKDVTFLGSKTNFTLVECEENSERNIELLELRNLKAKKRKYNEEIRVDDWINFCPNVDFAWKIDDISKKIKVSRNQRIFSDSFYSNGYKLCLYLRFSGDNIGLYCQIQKGAHDDKIQWPMRLSVNLSIEDQTSLKPFKTVTLRYDTSNSFDEQAFFRPINDANERSIREYPFITYSSIKDCPSIMVNDSIFISCLLSDN